jgi:hypothetical protein
VGIGDFLNGDVMSFLAGEFSADGCFDIYDELIGGSYTFCIPLLESS